MYPYMCGCMYNLLFRSFSLSLSHSFYFRIYYPWCLIQVRPACFFQSTTAAATTPPPTAVSAEVRVWESQFRTLTGWSASSWKEGDAKLDDLVHLEPLPGFIWDGVWQVATGESKDEDGWQYGMLLSTQWSARCRIVHTVRRRLWARIQRRR